MCGEGGILSDGGDGKLAEKQHASALVCVLFRFASEENVTRGCMMLALT